MLYIKSRRYEAFKNYSIHSEFKLLNELKIFFETYGSLAVTSARSTVSFCILWQEAHEGSSPSGSGFKRLKR